MQEHQRRSIRLPGYDYSKPGAYFITMVTWQRENLFGEIVSGEMRVNDWGIILDEEWRKTSTIRPEIELVSYQIMPNHIHAILIIHDVVGAHGRAPLPGNLAPLPERKPRTLGSCIAGIKSITTTRINQARHTPGIPVWQRNYYEHIIRNTRELERIHTYIQSNPSNWECDNENKTKAR